MLILKNTLVAIHAALSLLSRFPVGYCDKNDPTNAWAWPVAGIIIGGAAAVVVVLAQTIGWPPPIIAGAAIATQILATGALHEDGLADTADGFWGGWDAQRRLEIMKDSAIGSYGVIALTLVIGMKWAALSSLPTPLIPVVLIMVGALSRAPMVSLNARLEHARQTGLAHRTGRTTLRAECIAWAIAAGVGVIGLGLTAWLVVAVVALTTIAIARLAINKVGGQTGDILGASQQLTELAALLVLSAIWSS